MEQFLLALCGIPSSGKTSLARAIKDRLGAEIRLEVVSTDRWRDKEFYADFDPENERKVRKDALRITKDLIASGVSVIHDDTNYYTSMRHDLYEIAMKESCVFAVVYVSTSVENSIQWNLERGGPIPESVILKIHKKLDLPGSKYKWDTAIAEVDMAAIQANNAAQEIAEKLVALAPQKMKADQIAGTSSSDALLDVVTRQVVSRFLKECPELMEDKRVSKERRDILVEAKNQGYSADEVEQKLMGRLKNLDAHTV